MAGGSVADHARGWDGYHRDTGWADAVTRTFGRNLELMLAAAAKAGVPVLLVDPVANLKDCPPFKVEGGMLPEAKRARFTALYRLATAPDLPPRERERILEELVALDPLHAGAQYRLGQCRLFLGASAPAREALIQAKDQDVCPLRATEAMHRALARTAEAAGVPLVQGRALFERHAEHGIPGNDVLMDHVHPTLRGHQLLAGLLFDHLARLGVVTPAEGWKARAEASFGSHVRALQPAYFEQGMARRERVNRWARGRQQPEGSSRLPAGST